MKLDMLETLLETERSTLEDWEINEAAEGEMTWCRGRVDGVRIRDQENKWVTHSVTDSQNAVLRTICAEAISDPERHLWLQFEVGRLLGAAASRILAATAGGKSDAIARFGS